MIHTVISFLLRNRAIPSAIKNQVLTGAIAGISGVPLTASISVESDGSIMIHGKKLSALDMQALRESADGALNSVMSARPEEQLQEQPLPSLA